MSDHESAVGMLERRVRRQDRVVGLDDGGGHLRRRINGKLELGLFPIVHRKPLHQKRGEARTSTAAKRMEN